MMDSLEKLHGRSELILESQLDNTRIIRWSGDQAKAWRAHGVIWIAEVRRIRKVEELCSRAKALRFPDGNRSLKR